MNADLVHELLDEFEIRASYRAVPGQPLAERFAAIRNNYRVMAAAVAAGRDQWHGSDPYQIADWAALFTPIEAAMWHDIRAFGAPMWPQYPVGRFFVDFGDPVRRAAIECDGKRWHDPVRDAERDRLLMGMGWKVYRLTGAECFQEGPHGNPQQLLAWIYGEPHFGASRAPAHLPEAAR